MAYHAKLSPSGAHRWSQCFGAPLMEEGEPDGATDDAAEGTAGHEVFSECLSKGLDAEEFVGRVYEVEGYEIEIDEDLADYIQVSLDAVYARVEEYKLAGAIRVELQVEQAIDISFITGEKDATGRADLAILAYWSESEISLEVWDLKLGRGKLVLAPENLQCAMYSLGVIDNLHLLVNIRDVTVVITQPRKYSVPSEWRTSVEELRKYESKLYSRARYALNSVRSGLVLNPGVEQCYFCRANWKCKAFIGKAFEILDYGTELAGGDAQGVTLPNIENVLKEFKERMDKLTPEALGKLYPHIEFLELVAKTLRAKIHASNLNGGIIPGTKLVKGREGRRSWTDEEAASKEMVDAGAKEDALFTKKLISPTQVEKKFKKTAPQIYKRVVDLKLINRKPAGLSTVEEADPRPAEVLEQEDDSQHLD